MAAPKVEIRYCVRCKFLLRAAWLAQELLSTFETELAEVVLVPRRDGVFEVALDGETLFSFREKGRFPEAKEVKELLRNRIAPERVIGHRPRLTT